MKNFNPSFCFISYPVLGPLFGMLKRDSRLAMNLRIWIGGGV
jgi:hypothetical protein